MNVNKEIKKINKTVAKLKATGWKQKDFAKALAKELFKNEQKT